MTDSIPNAGNLGTTAYERLHAEINKAENITKNLNAAIQSGDLQNYATIVSQVRDIAYNGRALGLRNDGTICTDIFNTIISNLNDGDVLFIPKGTFKFNKIYPIVIDKSITIRGYKKPFYDLANDTMTDGTVLENCVFDIKANNVRIENIGLYNKNVDDCIRQNKVTSHGLRVDNVCLRAGGGHGVLIESYNGRVYDAIISNCESYKSSHGFISKADNVLFINCKAYNHMGGYGFGLISDNIQGADKIANGSNSQCINCKTYDCNTGFNSYSRDMFSATNDNNIELNNVKFINCEAYGGDKSFAVGIYNNPTGGCSNAIKNVLYENCVSNGANCSMELNRVDGLVVDNLLTDKDVSLVNPSYLKNIKKMFLTSKIIDFSAIQTLEANNSKPRLKFGYKNYKTSNTSLTRYTGFYCGVVGEEYNFLIDDTNTQFYYAGDILTRKQYYNDKATLKLVLNADGKWREVGGNFRPFLAYKQIDLVSESGDFQINPNECPNWEILGSGTTTNKIDINFNMPYYSNEVNILIKPGGSTFTFGGFSDKFYNVQDVPTTLTWDIGIHLKFAVIDYRWYLIDKFEVKITNS